MRAARKCQQCALATRNYFMQSAEVCVKVCVCVCEGECVCEKVCVCGMIAADKQATKRAKPQQRLILLIPCLCHTPIPTTEPPPPLTLTNTTPLTTPPVPSLVHFPLVFPEETLAAYGFHRSIANFLSFRLCAHFTKWQVETLPLYTSHTQFPPPLPFPFSTFSLYSCHQRHSNLSFASFFIMRRRLKQHDVFIFVVFIPRPMSLTPRPTSLVRVCVTGLLQVAFNLILHLLLVFLLFLLFHRSSARGLFAFVNM